MTKKDRRHPEPGVSRVKDLARNGHALPFQCDGPFFRNTQRGPTLVEKSARDEAAELFLSSAVVNIKKSRGTHRSSYDDLAQYGQTDGAQLMAEFLS